MYRAASAQSSPKPSTIRDSSHSVPTMLPDLDVMGGQHGRGLEEQRARLVGGAPALVVRVEEPVAEELELQVAKPVVVEDVA